MASPTHQSLDSHQSGVGELYFSYGSNMHLKQMAARCPESTLFAKGILRNHRWYINSRGGANVAEANQDNYVEGIVFTVPPSNIEILRGYEGVAKGFYVEKKFDIEIEPFGDPVFENLKPSEAVKILATYEPRPSADGAKSKPNHETKLEVEKIVRKALVYISSDQYLSPGTIRDEYIGRMQLSIADARILGVSQHYVETSLHPYIFGTQNGAQPETRAAS
ncbi:hypothetical protein F5Y04DRAFT_248420 [Hypomontagnella monticulosa]|nr:hypothetical protein F5Y04DRAFT_248420 [Hypomontagnella monticulosa]